MKIKTLLVTLGALFAVGSFTGFTIRASADSAVPVYRLYNHNTGEHFYTESAYEKSTLKNSGWNDEGLGWYSATKGAPVYRLYNPNSAGGDHYYTLSQYEGSTLVQQGWRWDNNGQPAFYSAGGNDLYVSYNPNASSGSHNYTTNHFEQNSLLNNGWEYGKVAWETMSAPKIRYEGWVSVDGVVKYRKVFDKASDAHQYAYSMYEQECLSNWDAKSISWGMGPVEE